MNTFPKITSFDKNNVTHPEAQFPLADPPLEVHSLDVKQVPFWLELKKKNHMNRMKRLLKRLPKKPMKSSFQR